MKRPIEWYESVIKNWHYTISEKQREIDRAISDLERVRNNCAFSEYQLALAKKRGLKEYDRDRLGIKRGEK